MEEFILTIGTITQTIRARKLLLGARIAARMIKRTGNQSGGCAYGLAIRATEIRQAMRTLHENGIAFEWTRETMGQ